MPGRKVIAAFLAVGFAVGGAGGVLAKSDKAKGGGKPGSGSEAAVAGVAAAGAILAGVLLSDRDRTTITRYFQQNPTPGTALPPGIAKNVGRGKPLPPGVAKRGLPNALTSRITIPRGYELQAVGTDVLLIEVGTRIVTDVLKEVLK